MNWTVLFPGTVAALACGTVVTVAVDDTDDGVVVGLALVGSAVGIGADVVVGKAAGSIEGGKVCSLVCSGSLRAVGW